MNRQAVEYLPFVHSSIGVHGATADAPENANVTCLNCSAIVNKIVLVNFSVPFVLQLTFAYCVCVCDVGIHNQISFIVGSITAIHLPCVSSTHPHTNIFYARLKCTDTHTLMLCVGWSESQLADQNIFYASSAVNIFLEYKLRYFDKLMTPYLCIFTKRMRKNRSARLN